MSRFPGPRHLLVLCLCLATLLSGCSLFIPRKAPSPAPPVAGGVTKPGAAVGPSEGYSAYGNPEFYEVMGKRYRVLKTGHGFVERGIASWYGPDFHGKLTSTREVYDMYQMTGAHKLLPLPTWVKVTNLENGRSVVLRVNDRGPFKDNRVIDLSYAAALKLDVVNKGTAFVEVRAVDRPDDQPPGPSLRLANNTEMYLQIGAFGQRDNAERLRERVDGKLADPIRIYEDRSGARPLFKVQVGPLTDVDHADRAIAALAGVGITQHHFVNGE